MKERGFCEILDTAPTWLTPIYGKRLMVHKEGKQTVVVDFYGFKISISKKHIKIIPVNQ